MALPLLPILAGAGSLIGGIQGYRQSGGDLGSTALGALTGGTLTSGIGGLGRRFAGAALGKTALGQMAPKLMQAGNPLGAVLAAAPAAAGVGAAGLLGLPAAAALSGPLGGAGSRLTGQAARAAGGAVGLGQQATGIGLPQMPGVPQYDIASDISRFGPPNAANYADPTGYIQSQLRLENQQTQQALANALLAAKYEEAYGQRSKEADYLRGAAAAQLNTALQTDSAMRRQGQLGAQRMAEGLLDTVGRAATTQYNYF